MLHNQMMPNDPRKEQDLYEQGRLQVHIYANTYTIHIRLLLSAVGNRLNELRLEKSVKHQELPT